MPGKTTFGDYERKKLQEKLNAAKKKRDSLKKDQQAINREKQELRKATPPDEKALWSLDRRAANVSIGLVGVEGEIGYLERRLGKV